MLCVRLDMLDLTPPTGNTNNLVKKKDLNLTIYYNIIETKNTVLEQHHLNRNELIVLPLQNFLTKIPTLLPLWYMHVLS